MSNNEQNNVEMHKGILSAIAELSSSLNGIVGCNIITLRENGDGLETVTQVFPSNQFALLRLAKTNVMTAMGIIEQLAGDNEEMKQYMGFENLQNTVSQLSESSEILAFSSLLDSIFDDGDFDKLTEDIKEELTGSQDGKTNLEDGLSDEGFNDKNDEDFSRL